jgi:hypothetical protein
VPRLLAEEDCCRRRVGCPGDAIAAGANNELLAASAAPDCRGLAERLWSVGCTWLGTSPHNRALRRLTLAPALSAAVAGAGASGVPAQGAGPLLPAGLLLLSMDSLLGPCCCWWWSGL